MLETEPTSGNEQITLILSRIDIVGEAVSENTDSRTEISSEGGGGLTDNSVETDHIVNDAVTSDKIEDYTITLNNINTGTAAELKQGNTNEIKIYDEEATPVHRFSIQYKYNITEAEHRLYLYFVNGTSYSYIAYIDQLGNLKVSGNVDADNV